MAAWDDFQCQGPNVVKVADNGADPDVVDGLLGQGSVGTTFADITHAGWLPAAFFNAIAPNGSASILGVTFTFVFAAPRGRPTSTAITAPTSPSRRSITTARSRGAPAATSPTSTSRASPPRGRPRVRPRSLRQGHGGFATFEFHYSPKAIMNAVYVQEDRRILGTDIGSFCSIGPVRLSSRQGELRRTTRRTTLRPTCGASCFLREHAHPAEHAVGEVDRDGQITR